MPARRRNDSRKPRTPKTPGPAVATRRPPKVTTMVPSNFTGKERLATLQGNADGSPVIESYDYNPGLASTFSVGHNMALAHNSYTVPRGCVNRIQWIPSTATTRPGVVYILIEYVPTDRAPTTEAEFLDSQHCTATQVWQPVTASIEPKEPNRRYLVRTNCSVQSKLFTDMCTIHVAAFGYGSTTENLGTMFIHYQAKLHSRQPAIVAPRLPINTAVLTMTDNQAIPLGTATVNFNTLRHNTCGATIENTNTVRLGPGAYAVSFHVPVDHAQRIDERTYTACWLEQDSVALPLATHTRISTYVNFSTDMFQTARYVAQVSESSVFRIVAETDHPDDITVVASRASLTFELIG